MYNCVCVCVDRGARVNDKANGVRCEQQVSLGKGIRVAFETFSFYNLSIHLKLFPSLSSLTT